MTETDLATLVLQKLGVVGAGEDPDASDASKVIAAYERYYGELDERGLAYWPVATIPARCAEGLKDVLVARQRPDFTTGQYSEMEFVAAERALLRVIMPGVTNYERSGEYY